VGRPNRKREWNGLVEGEELLRNGYVTNVSHTSQPHVLLPRGGSSGEKEESAVNLGTRGVRGKNSRTTLKQTHKGTPDPAKGGEKEDPSCFRESKKEGNLVKGGGDPRRIA